MSTSTKGDPQHYVEGIKYNYIYYHDSKGNAIIFTRKNDSDKVHKPHSCVINIRVNVTKMYIVPCLHVINSYVLDLFAAGVKT